MQTLVPVLPLCIHFTTFVGLEVDLSSLHKWPQACSEVQAGPSDAGQKIRLAMSLFK